MSAFRLGRPKPKPKIMLERAKTVASGLGQNPKNEIATVAEAEDFGISRANSPKDEAFHTFCRGSLKRLKKAESKVSVAKRDMEEILEQAKVMVTHYHHSPSHMHSTMFGVLLRSFL